MFKQEDLIERLGIEDLPENEQEAIVEMAIYRIGDAVTRDLTEDQFAEYSAIVDDDHDVINEWLQKNVPNYKDLPAFQEIVAGYEDDPEKNDPKKLFASMAWFDVNAPNTQQLIDSAIEAYKNELSSK